MPIDATSKRRERGLACAGVLAATVLATSAVQAQVTQPTDPGVMSFDNVRIVSKPAAATPSAAPESAAGFRAYIDRDTGRLTQTPGPDQIRELESARPMARSFGPLLAPIQARSGIALRLDDSFMLHSVVRIGANGDLEEACVQGDELTRAFLGGQGTPLQQAHEARAVK